MVSSCFTNRATRNQTCWRRSKKSVLFNLMAAKSKYTVHEKRLLTATEGVQEVSVGSNVEYKRQQRGTEDQEQLGAHRASSCMEANQLRASNSAHLDKSTEAARSFAKIKWRQVSSLLEVAISGGHSKSLGAAPSCKDVQVVVQQVEWRSDVRKSRGEGAYTMLPEETDPQQHHMQDFAALGYDFCDGPSSDDPCCVVRSSRDLAEQEQCKQPELKERDHVCNCGVPSREMDGPSVDG